MASSIQALILEASFIPVGATAIIGLLRFWQLTPPLRYLVGVIFAEIFIEVASRLLAVQGRHNLFLAPFDTLLEFTFLALMYQRALRPLVISRWIGPGMVVFALVSLLTLTQPAQLTRFNTVQRFVESLLVLGLVLSFLYKTLRELVVIRLEREPLFWVSAGLLLYFAGNIFIFVSSNYILQHSPALSLEMWDIHALLYMVLHGFYIVALWVRPLRKN